MELSDFKSRFGQLTGFEPMPWQSRLYREYFDKGEVPAAADIPTGLGKTAIIALWLIAIRAGRPLPRRLVYVVDRRAVVDQATTFVENLRDRLPEGERFPISTLRGKHADNREWLDDPSRPAIIVGTVDMIGSRLLFEGYGVSRKMRPYQAGLLGADSLIVLDEAHLVPPFERLLEQIETGVDFFGPRDDADRALVPGLRLLSLSATGRGRSGQPFGLEDRDLGDSGSLTRHRLDAVKVLTVRVGIAKDLPEDLAGAAWELTGSGALPLRCLIYCNSREQAEKTYQGLETRINQRFKGSESGPRPYMELFIGARRGHERQLAEQRLRSLGFLAGSESKHDYTRFLIATSAGEVGVDLDADHMVCDLVPWERMVQRLGRVNRRGDGEARVIVIDAGPAIPKSAGGSETQQTDMARRHVRELLTALPPQGDGFDASPRALRDMKLYADPERMAAIESATTPAPLYPSLTRALVDAWSMTSLKTHTGRPEVAPWVRGWTEEEPRTVIVWRAYLPVPAEVPETERDRKAWAKETTAYFEAAPPHVSEQLETESYRVAAWLVSRAKKILDRRKAARKKQQEAEQATAIPAARDVVAMTLTGAGDFARPFRLAELAEADKKRLQRELSGKLLIVVDAVGGLALDKGTLDPTEDQAPSWLGDFDESWTPEEREPEQRVIPWRVIRIEGQEPELAPGWRKRFEFEIRHDEEGEAASRLAVYKWRQAAANEDDRALGREQKLDAHSDTAAQKARQIAENLNLPEQFVRLLTVAARLHDEGKESDRWQTAFSAPKQGRPYAKTAGPINASLLDGYRHELGSLLRAGGDDDVQALSLRHQELVQHLIASHHGHARPMISSRGCEDGPPSLLETTVHEVALRFARLQRRWGPWGLAWWESLLRAADQQASRDNERGEG